MPVVSNYRTVVALIGCFSFRVVRDYARNSSKSGDLEQRFLISSPISEVYNSDDYADSLFMRL